MKTKGGSSFFKLVSSGTNTSKPAGCDKKQKRKKSPINQTENSRDRPKVTNPASAIKKGVPAPPKPRNTLLELRKQNTVGAGPAKSNKGPTINLRLLNLEWSKLTWLPPAVTPKKM